MRFAFSAQDAMEEAVKAGPGSVSLVVVPTVGEIRPAVNALLEAAKHVARADVVTMEESARSCALTLASPGGPSVLVRAAANNGARGVVITGTCWVPCGLPPKAWDALMAAMVSSQAVMAQRAAAEEAAEAEPFGAWWSANASRLGEAFREVAWRAWLASASRRAS